MPRGVSRDAKHFRELLEKAVVLVDGGSDGYLDIGAGESDPIWVAIMVDVSGYGPHVGTVYAYQNRFHGNPDEPLQEAEEMLEEWKRENEGDYLRELEEEWGERADEVFRETFDGWSFRLNPREFGEAIRGTDAEKYFDLEDSHKEKLEELEDKLGELLAFYKKNEADYESEGVSSSDVKARSGRIERLLGAGDLQAAEREIEALDKIL
jgi:hypothetical protein